MRRAAKAWQSEPRVDRFSQVHILHMVSVWLRTSPSTTERERDLERAPLERTSLYLYRICMHLCACMYCVCICKRENVRRHTKCSRTGLQTMHPGAVPRNSTNAGRALTNFFLPFSSSRYGCKAHAAVKVLCPPRRLWIRGLSSQSKVVSVFFRHDLAHY